MGEMPCYSTNIQGGPYRYRLKSFNNHRLKEDTTLTMASGPHTFVTCSVFSPEKFQGNPIAIVAVRGNALTQQRKSLMAKEFGYPMTVFIHDAPGPTMPRRIETFTEHGDELPFAGLATLGAAHYIFSWCEKLLYRGPQDRDTQRQTAVFMTKLGPSAVFYNPYRQIAACSIPQDFRVHKQSFSLDQVLEVQPQLRIVPTIDKCQGKKFPIVSLLNGLTYGLVDFTDAPEMLGALKKSEAPEMKLDEDWSSGNVGCLYYKRKEELTQEGEPTIHSLQARMITRGVEDPGTGSACCALACYMALGNGTTRTAKPMKQEQTEDQDELIKKTEQVKLEDTGKEQKLDRHVYAIQQGTEMGRSCMICVEIDLKKEPDGTKKIVNVTLSGRATFVLKGELIGG